MLNSSQDDFSVRINTCAGFRCINVTTSFEGTVPRAKLIGMIFWIQFTYALLFIPNNKRYEVAILILQSLFLNISWKLYMAFSRSLLIYCYLNICLEYFLHPYLFFFSRY
jgi:hypothetical protein